MKLKLTAANKLEGEEEGGAIELALYAPYAHQSENKTRN